MRGAYVAYWDLEHSGPDYCKRERDEFGLECAFKLIAAPLVIKVLNV